MTDISTTITSGAAANSSPTGTQAGTQESIAASQLSQDFDDFLTLLTTQLQHQDPFDPMDTAEFTNQLVQFSQVEQQINMNSKLTSLLDLQTTSQAALGISYIGLEAMMKGDSFRYLGGTSEIGYSLPVSSEQTQIHIIDGNGVPVRTLTGETRAGNHAITWDGTDDNGFAVPQGTYRVQVSALDEDNEPIETGTTVPGLIEGFETDDNGNILLDVGNQLVPVTDVTAAHLPGTSGS